MLRKQHECIGFSIMVIQNPLKLYGCWAAWSKILWVYMCFGARDAPVIALEAHLNAAAPEVTALLHSNGRSSGGRRDSPASPAQGAAVQPNGTECNLFRVPKPIWVHRMFDHDAPNFTRLLISMIDHPMNIIILFSELVKLAISDWVQPMWS